MNYIVGIDEAGRGPLAGPVALGVCRFQNNVLKSKIKTAEKNICKLKDSKKLSAKQRELWFVQMKDWQKEGICRYAVVYGSARQIDAKGLSVVIARALARGLMNVEAENTDQILLDGGLKAPVQFKKQKTIIKGDEKEAIISLASIVAKVSRDQLIVRESKKYPQYGLEIHKGYGTKAHYRAIQKHGISLIHRKTFLKKILMVQ